jgi:DNA polymerase-1
MSKTLFLIDGNSYLHRNYHGRPEDFTEEGVQNHAFNGTIKMINKDIARFGDISAVVFDHEFEYLRHSIYKDYKANRPLMPPELRTQLNDLEIYLKAKGIGVFKQIGIEADDIIATIARRITKNLDYKVLVSTIDKDFLQMVGEKISLIDTKNDDYITDHNNVNEKFGVAPHLIPDFLTLMGDKADNLKFLNRVGEKTAEKLINQYGSLEGVFENVDKIKQKGLKEQIINNKDNLVMAKKLITFFDINMELTLKMFDIGEKNLELVESLEEKYEFKKIVKRNKNLTR